MPLPKSRRKRGEVKTGENNNSSRFQRTAIGETVEPVAPRILSAVLRCASEVMFSMLAGVPGYVVATTAGPVGSSQ
jgi:hypothetical protein